MNGSAPRSCPRPAPAAPTEAEWRTILAPHATDVWPMARLVRLCLGWQAGEKTRALAIHLQTTKNALVSLEHRLAAKGVLVGRPSPIVRAAGSDERRPTPVPVPVPVPVATLPALPSAVAQPEPPRYRPPPPPRPATPRYGRVTDCLWPVGEPDSPGFHFCDAPTEPGRPYCGEHARIAFVRVRQPGASIDADARPAP